MAVRGLRLIAQRGEVEIGSWSLEPGCFTIGGDPRCSIPLEPADAGEESFQISLEDDGSVYLETGPSRVSVDGQPVEGRVPVALHQSIGLGRISLVLEPGAFLPPEFHPGERYAIGPEIAKGGMGAILRVRQSAIRRSVAMKVILGAAEQDDRQRLRFIEEAQITGQLEHPNVVPVHDAGVDAKGRVFYTMKLVQGITLKEILAQLKKGDAEAAQKYALPALLTIFQKVCDAVAFAHAKGVIHRDLKPANIMVGAFGEVLVMDWGLARLLRRDPDSADVDRLEADIPVRTVRFAEGDAFATMEGSIVGTPAYMAPEQARGELNQLDERSDIFALGAILYELLTLSRPFPGKNAREILDRLISGEPPRPPREGKGAGDEPALLHLPGRRVPEALSAVSLKALAFRPEDRYASLLALQKDLAAYQGGFATSAESKSLWKSATLLVKRHKAIFGSAFAAWLIITAMAAIFIVKLTASERRAVANERSAREALASLHDTAPTFFGQAQALVEQQQFEEALQKISYAVSLAPDDAEYRVQRGHIFESLLRLDDARTEYREALRLEPGRVEAQENLRLCDELLRENGPNSELTPPVLTKLQKELTRQGRFAEALSHRRVVTGDQKQLYEIWLAKLKASNPRLVNRYWGNWEQRLTMLENGLLSLDLRGVQIDDLKLLKGAPLGVLNLTSCSGVADLTPLQGLPLTVLNLTRTKVTDLRPLEGMALRKLILTSTAVADLSPLRGMPLDELSISGTTVSDLTPLKGAPLTRLDASNCPGIADLTPLKGMPLRNATFSSDNYKIIGELADLSPLRDSPLEELSLNNHKVHDLTPLRGRPLKKLRLGAVPRPNQPQFQDLGVLQGMALTDLEVTHTTITDFQPIAGLKLRSLMISSYDGRLRDLNFLREMPLESLELNNTNVTDLTPLASVKSLHRLVMNGPVTDLSPLADLPLTTLFLSGSKVRDLSPLSRLPLAALYLANCNDLKEIRALGQIRSLSTLILPKKPKEPLDISFLRLHPTLTKLGNSSEPGSWSADAQRVQDYWKAYDARQPAK